MSLCGGLASGHSPSRSPLSAACPLLPPGVLVPKTGSSIIFKQLLLPVLKEFLRVGGTHLEALERGSNGKIQKKKNAVRGFCHRYLRDDLGELSPMRELALCWAAASQPTIV